VAALPSERNLPLPFVAASAPEGAFVVPPSGGIPRKRKTPSTIPPKGGTTNMCVAPGTGRAADRPNPASAKFAHPPEFLCAFHGIVNLTIDLQIRRSGPLERDDDLSPWRCLTLRRKTGDCAAREVALARQVLFNLNEIATPCTIRQPPGTIRQPPGTIRQPPEVTSVNLR
jgi:hypothetical protein